MMRLRLDPPRLRSGTLAPLASGDYRRLLASDGLWWTTLFMETIVVGWLVFERSNSAWTVALVGFCRSIPFLLFGFVNGPLIDRFGRRKVIVAAQTANLLVYVALSSLLWFDRLALWHLAVGALVLGSAWALDWPARRALLPDLVGKERTVDAMLLESFVQSSARIAGPFIAGAVIAGFGALGCYLVLMTLSAASLLIVRTLSGQAIPRTSMRPQASPWTLIGEGLRYVGHSQPILGVLLITVVMNLLIFPYMTLLPIFARDVLGRGPLGLGLLGTASGVGAFAGLLVIQRIRGQVNSGLIFTGGTFFMCLAITVFALSSFYPLSWSMLLLAGIGQACFGIMQSSIILLTASDEMRSRAMGMLVLAIGSDPLGKLQTGALAEAFGAPAALALQAMVAAVSIAVIGVALPGLRRAAPEASRAVEGVRAGAGD